MGKIRASAVKPKRQVDFKRKKAKVGRTVERSNVTKISVKSKKIVLLDQSKESLRVAEDDINIDALLRLTTHYDPRNRISGLVELKQAFGRSSNAKFVAVTLPAVMELLYDGSNDVRTTFLDLLQALFDIYSEASFLPVISVIVTYLCSGMTSLNPLVRKDTVHSLHIILKTHPRLLLDYRNKIIDHMLTLLENSIMEGKANSIFIAGGDVITKASETVMSKVNTEEQQYRQQRREYRSTIVLASFDVLRLLIDQPQDARQQSSVSFSTLKCLSDFTTIRSGRNPACLMPIHTKQGNSGTSILGSSELSHASVSRLCSVIGKLWEGSLPPSPGPIAAKLETPFASMLLLIYSLVPFVDLTSSSGDEIKNLLVIICRFFPYISIEDGSFAKDLMGVSDSDSDSVLDEEDKTVNSGFIDPRKVFRQINMIISELVITTTPLEAFLTTDSSSKKLRGSGKIFSSCSSFAADSLRVLLESIKDDAPNTLSFTPKNYYTRLLKCQELLFSIWNSSLNFRDREPSLMCPDGNGVLMNFAELCSLLRALGSTFKCPGYLNLVETTAVCLCNCSGAAITNILHNFDSAPKDLSAQVVAKLINGFSSLLFLLEIISEKQVSTVDRIMHNALLAISPASLLIDCAQGVAQQNLREAILEMNRIVLDILCSEESNFVDKFLLTQRSLLFDLWFTSSSGTSVVSGAQRVVKKLSLGLRKGVILFVKAYKSSTGNATQGRVMMANKLDEVKYFMRLFLEKRFELSFDDFVDVIVMGLDSLLTSIFKCTWSLTDMLKDSSQDRAATGLALEDALVTLVGTAASTGETLLFQLISCSSAEKPLRIYSIIFDKIQEIFETTTLSRVDSPVMTVVRLGTFYRLAHFVTARLAASARQIDVKEGSNSEFESLLDKYASFGGKVLLSLLSPGPVPTTTTMHFLLHESMHFYDFIEISVRGRFVAFETLIDAVLTTWCDITQEELLTIYNLLHQFLNRFEAAPLIASCRGTIDRYLAQVLNSSSASSETQLVPQSLIHELRTYMSSI